MSAIDFGLKSTMFTEKGYLFVSGSIYGRSGKFIYYLLRLQGNWG